MMSLRKLLFRTGEKMMVWSFALSLLIPAYLEKLGILKLIGGGGQRVGLAFAFGALGFLLLLPVTAPLLGIGWVMVRLSFLDKA